MTKKPPNIASDPHTLEDAGETIQRTPGTERTNKIRRDQFSATGNMGAGLARPTKGQSEWTKKFRASVTGESEESTPSFPLKKRSK